ncbi:hypothetical protein G4B88_009823 [Cannabis sativa]|uniref:Uncharacterized protein n=1 Tax=Cannabis sativa TaxID=3483 RepID=A0A7J6HSG2_CANSA|nr:hypothetical protein G4B88_009823 [Cannabis sativa]
MIILNRNLNKKRKDSENELLPKPKSGSSNPSVEAIRVMNEERKGQEIERKEQERKYNIYSIEKERCLPSKIEIERGKGSEEGLCVNATWTRQKEERGIKFGWIVFENIRTFTILPSHFKATLLMVAHFVQRESSKNSRRRMEAVELLLGVCCTLLRSKMLGTATATKILATLNDDSKYFRRRLIIMALGLRRFGLGDARTTLASLHLPLPPLILSSLHFTLLDIQNCEAINDILNIDNKATGQFVNLAKSSFYQNSVLFGGVQSRLEVPDGLACNALEEF